MRAGRRRSLATGGAAIALFAATVWPAAALAAQRATPTPPPPANLLRNGDFEAASARQWNAANGEWANGRVAAGWTAWWRKPTDPDGAYPGQCPEDDAACQAWHRPEYRDTRGIPYDPPRVHGGDNSQMMFTSFGVHEGGLYQTAGGVPRGWRVRFSIWLRAWSSDTENTAQSSSQPSMNLRIGIDPAGGVDPWGNGVVWSDVIDSFDVFSQVSVAATAQSESVTVFVRSRPDRALKHVDLVMDDAELVLLGPPPPTPVIIDAPARSAGAATPDALIDAGGARQVVEHIVQPGDTLFAIAQRYRADLSAIYAANGLNEASALKVGQAVRVPLPVNAPPTAAPAPPPPTPAPVLYGTLCLNAFVDANADGRYGDGDQALPGAAFVVADEAGRAVATAAASRCISDLPVGAYAVSAQLPAGYTATTETHWGVALTRDARVELVAGGQPALRSAGDEPPGASLAIGAGSIVFIFAAVMLMRRRVKS